jgi:DNA invertase Pin-like site-specific DNA recombinase
VDCPDADDLFLHMKAVYAQYEHKKISERTKATMQVAKQRGAVFGTSCKQLAMNNKQAAYDFAVKMAPIIASLRKQGFKTVRAMAKELNRRKIPTARQLLPSLSCPRWHITTVYALLLRIQDMGNGTTDI